MKSDATNSSIDDVQLDKQKFDSVNSSDSQKVLPNVEDQVLMHSAANNKGIGEYAPFVSPFIN